MNDHKAYAGVGPTTRSSLEVLPPLPRLANAADDARLMVVRLEGLADRLVGAVTVATGNATGPLNRVPSSVAETLSAAAEEFSRLAARANDAIARIESQF